MALHIPASDFEKELTPGSATTAKKATEATTENMLMVEPGKITPIEGFNVRIDTPDYLEHLANVKESIKTNGFYPNKPLGGYVGKEDDATALMLTDGYTRWRAACELVEEGLELRVPFVPKPAGTTLEDLTIALVQDNEGRPLSVFERAIVVKRLVGYGMEESEIARRLGVTPRYISDLLVLAGASAKVRNLVINGKVAATEAVKQLRKDAGKAGEVLTEAVKVAESRGKSRATAKDAKAAAGAKENKKRKSGVSASITTRGGKTHTTLTYFYKAGDVLPVDDQFKAVRLFDDATWWNFIDEETKADFIVEETVEITVTIVKEAKEEVDDTFDVPDEPAPAPAAKAEKKGKKALPAPEAAKDAPDPKDASSEASEAEDDEL